MEDTKIADFEIGNGLADQEAKRAAEITEVKALSLIPDGKIQTISKLYQRRLKIN